LSPPPPAPSTPGDDTPLDPQHAQQLDTVGVELHAALRDILACLSRNDRTAHGLAKRFGIEGVIARRLVRAAASEPGLITLTRMPAEHHLRAFAQRIDEANIHRDACGRLHRAIDAVEHQHRTIGGSKARMTKRIRATLRDQPTIRATPLPELRVIHTNAADLKVVDAHNEVWAGVWTGNLLSDLDALPDEAPGRRLIAWSGSRSEDDLFARDPSTWMPAGLEELHTALDRLSTIAQDRGWTISIRPHARHVLCDAQRTRTMFTQHERPNIGLVLDPLALLERDMLDQWEEHTNRNCEALAPLVRALWLENIAPPRPDDDDDAPFARVPLEDGFIDAARLRALVDAHADASIPRIVRFDA
jgi:hypothetical protein